MEKKKELALLFCAIIGAIADVVAVIIALVNWNVSLIIFSTTLIVLLFTIIYIYMRYKERCDFLHFVQHLFDNHIHNFNLLPKICLALDKSKEINNICVRELQIEYTYDMSNVETETLASTDKIYYTDTIEYQLNVENTNLPEEYICLLGNMYAKDDTVHIVQKHGAQKDYETVPAPRYTDDTKTDSIVQRYCWQLKKENINRSNTIPICFRLKYNETAKANSNDTIIIYPYQYARSIETIDFQLNFLCEKQILKRVELFKIRKSGKEFKHMPDSSIIKSGNSASVKIQLDSSKYEAYYFRVYWELV